MKPAAREIEVMPQTAPVDRRPVDDPRAWADLVQLLADLLYPANPDEPPRR
jgi:hypothetical protein